MLFVNQTDSVVTLAIGPGLRVEPKKTIDIPDGYSHPRRADNGSRRPSVVEELAGGLGAECKLVPADQNERAQWLQAPSNRRFDPKVASMPTVEGYIAAGMARPQAEALVRQAHQAIIDSLNKGDEKAKGK